jgi:murein DD-endopeptidase MepM/ murein hydrolase activator NlpD
METEARFYASGHTPLRQAVSAKPKASRMQLIFVNKRGLPRRLDLRHPLHALLLLLALTPPLLLAAFIGSRAAGYDGGDANSDAHVARWRAQIAQQQKDIDAAKRKTAQDVAALGQQVGTLHAEVIRLDALGARLVQMAALDRGEFNFSEPPAVGGPLDDGSSAIESTGLQGTLDDLATLLSDRSRQLDVLEHFLLTQKLENRVEPRGEPVDTAWISSYFGRRSDPFTGQTAHHMGIDFAGRLGSPVKAVADGVVSWSGPRNGYGNMVEVNHGNGLTTRYGHNSKNLVAVGDTVTRGEVIALIGETGRATGPHLHFEVLQDGHPQNPMAYIRNSDKSG